MKKLWMLLIALLIMVGCCRNDGMIYTPSAGMMATGKQVTVALVMLRQGGYPRTYCSGVWIGESTILTAAHCVADVEKDKDVLFAQYGDSDWGPGHEARILETHTGRVVKIDEDVDLALIHGVTWRPHPSVSLAKSVKVGDGVMIVGHPVGLLWNQITGSVSAIRYLMDQGHGYELMIQISAPVWYGNSGGPALDAKGDLVGIASYIIPGSGMSFFVSQYEVAKFLAR